MKPEDDPTDIFSELVQSTVRQQIRDAHTWHYARLLRNNLPFPVVAENKPAEPTVIPNEAKRQKDE